MSAEETKVEDEGQVVGSNHNKVDAGQINRQNRFRKGDIMRNKRITVVVCFCIAFFAMFAFCCGNGHAAEKILIKMAGTLPVQNHLTKALEMYKDIVEKKSGGQIEMQVYPAQQLYSDKDLVNALPKGACEGALLNADLWAGLVKSEGPIFFTGYFQNRDLFYKLFDSEAWQIIKKDFEDQGNIKILSMVELGPGGLVSKKPIRKLDDLKGQRIRSYGEYTAIFLQAQGAAPVVMSSGDMYMALQRGTLDAILSSVAAIVDRKLYEVGKYMWDQDTTPSIPFLMAFNLDFWKKLPPNMQKILADGAIEVQEWSKKYTLTSDIANKKALKEKGVTFVSLDPAEWQKIHEKAVQALDAGFIKNVGEQKGQKILSIIKKTCF
jgi:TRAP-type C4-dicarboxylate transport system substrate-binding protein